VGADFDTVQSSGCINYFHANNDQKSLSDNYFEVDDYDDDGNRDNKMEFEYNDTAGMSSSIRSIDSFTATMSMQSSSGSGRAQRVSTTIVHGTATILRQKWLPVWTN
jgi:hypothetical protein